MPEEPEEQPSEWKENLVAIIIVLVVILTAVAYFVGWFGSSEEVVSEQIYLVGIDDDEVLGNFSAPVTIIEFSDYQCPACQAFEQQTMPLIKEQYIDTGKVRLVYRDFPLDRIHPYARLAAEAAECAEKRYWEFHDALYSRTTPLSRALIDQIAVDLGINITACLEERKYATEVQGDIVDATNQGGVTATPTFFINGRKVIGGQPFATFKEIIDEALES